MLSMVPGGWYQRPQQVSGLTLAQAVSPSLQQRPQPALPTTLPVPPQPQYLAAPPEGKPYGGTDYAEFGYYDDQALAEAFHYEANPDRSKRMLLELTRRRVAAPGDWSELTPIDQRPVDPGFSQMQVTQADLNSPGPKGNYGPAWSSPSQLPDSLQRNPYEGTPSNSPDPASGTDPEMAALLAGLLGGGAEGSGGYSSPPLPGLPPRPEFGRESPDFGAYPTAPVLSAPDFSQANRYFEEAKPEGYTADPEEMGLAVLSGALGSFSPYGSVGEILGRMAGPGIQGGFGQYKEDKALSRQADRDMDAWNAAMGGVSSDQSVARSNVDATNAQNQYQNAVGKYQDAQSRYQMAREDERWQAGYDLQRAQAELQRAEMQMRQPLLDAQIGYYNRRGQTGGAGSGLSMGSIVKTITDGVNAGALPGIEGMNEQLEATKQALLVGAQQDPNKLALYMGDPKQLDVDARRMLVEQIYQLAVQNPKLMQQFMLSSMKGKTGYSMEDVILGLSGE